MLITDAQVHLWEVDRPDRPWPVPLRLEPHRPNGFGAEEMLAEMDAVGVDRAVIVPPSWVGENNNGSALEMAARYPARFAVMGRFDALAAGARDQLEGWLRQPHMLGVRMTFHVDPMRSALDDGLIDWFWAACERLGIPAMVFLPGIADKAGPIAGRHPNLTLVIDHMGLPLNARREKVYAELDRLLPLAAHPNVVVKVTSAPSFSTEDYPYADLHDFLHRIYDAFGAQRMLWGTDITRLKGTYGECLSLFHDALDFLSPEDKEWVLGRSAARALNWPETSDTDVR